MINFFIGVLDIRLCHVQDDKSSKEEERRIGFQTERFHAWFFLNEG